MFLIAAIFSVFIFALSCQVASFAVAVAIAIACFCVFLESFSVPRSPTSATTAAAAAAAAEGTVQRFFAQGCDAAFQRHSQQSETNGS